MRCRLLLVLLSSWTVWAQTSQPSPPSSSQPASSANSPSPDAQTDSASSSKTDKSHSPDLSPPRSDSVPATALEEGSSSSKETQVDLSAPADDAKGHPRGAEAANDAETSDAARSGDVSEFHPWDPHKAAKDVEVGDFYFKRKNYAAAEDRYREALYYKDNDATATFRLAECLEKTNRPNEARQQYERYLKILPHGPEAMAARKAIDRLKVARETKASK